jgi:parallel beta-helix repeat protein
MYSDTTLCGDGDCSILYFDDDIILTRRDLLNIHNTSNVTFRDFKILGTADRDEVQTNQSQCLIGDIVNGLRIENVTFEGLRFMSTAFSYVTDGTFIGNRLVNCMRDGIRAVNSYNITVTGNHFRRFPEKTLL